jgi:DNA-binding MarR family transcriptional regulator
METARARRRLSPPRGVWRRTSFLLAHASSRAYRLMDEHAGEGRALRQAYGFLAATAEEGPLSQAELGRRLGIDPKDVVMALNALEREQLITRAPDPRDGRRNVVTITAAGRTRLRQLEGVLDAVHEELLEPLSPQERDQLNGLLRRLVAFHFGGPDAHDADPPAAGQAG